MLATDHAVPRIPSRHLPRSENPGAPGSLQRREDSRSSALCVPATHEVTHIPGLIGLGSDGNEALGQELLGVELLRLQSPLFLDARLLGIPLDYHAKLL